ncbi:MAG: phosphoadenosine phosphosulfate reductase family protein [Sulfolobales archaeon]
MRAIKIPLWWCSNCNIPLREPRCSRCGSAGTRVNLTDPGDIRPAFEGDLAFISEALLNEFGDSSIEKLLGISEGSTFLNKVPFIDDMKEVIVGGVIVGRLFFDIKSMKWRWRLSESSAQVLVDNGKVDYVVRDRVKPLEVIKCGGPEGSQLPVVDGRGKPIALAVCRGGFFRVQKVFRGTPCYPITKPRASLADVLKGNEYRLRRLVSLAASKAYSLSEKLRKPLVASYSGGKDSLVSLHVCLEVGFEPRILFNDTGLELPDTLSNVKEVSKLFSLELDYVSSGDAFWRALDTFGPPAKDYRWCCKVIKLAPIAKYYRENYPSGALVIVGQRAYESLHRFRSGYLWRNKWLPSVLNMSPIQEWDQLTEWLYIFERQLPYNTLYKRGFDRLGCYLCPAANIAEYCLIEKLYPDLWDTWVHELLKWQSATGQTYEWVKYHLWRWLGRNSPGRQRITRYLNLSGIVEGTPADAVIPLRGSRLGITVKPLEKSLTLESAFYDITTPIISQKSVLGLVISKTNHGDAILLVKPAKNSATKVLLHKNGKSAVIEGVEVADVAYNLVKLVSRWYKCVKCGNCSFWCPSNAVTVAEGRPKVDQRKCSSCRICLEVCPIASVYVDKLERYKLGYVFEPKKKKEVRFVLELYKAITMKNVLKTSSEVSYDSNLETLNLFLELE